MIPPTCMLLAAALMLALSSAGAQERYFDELFTDVDVTPDVVYGAAPDYGNVVQNLLLDIYTPRADNVTLRPVIIIVHGGGFTSGSKDGEYFQDWARRCARRGFVAASINYRLGIAGRVEERSVVEASLRAQQDVRASVRYLRAQAHVLGIDTSRIYLLGTSAGGIAALHAAVLETNEVPDYVSEALTDVEGSSGTPGLSSTVHGVASCWGAVTDTMNIDANAPPIVAIHGTADGTVPHECSNTAFGVVLCGSTAIAARARNVGIDHALQLFPGAGHTLSGNPVYLDSCFAFLATFFANLATRNVTTVPTTPVPAAFVWHTVYDLYGRQIACLPEERHGIDATTLSHCGLPNGLYCVLGKRNGLPHSLLVSVP